MNNEESNLKNKVLMAVFKYFILHFAFHFAFQTEGLEGEMKKDR